MPPTRPRLRWRAVCPVLALLFGAKFATNGGDECLPPRVVAIATGDEIVGCTSARTRRGGVADVRESLRHGGELTGAFGNGR